MGRWAALPEIERSPPNSLQLRTGQVTAANRRFSLARNIQLSAFTAVPLAADLLTLVPACLVGAEIKNMELSGPQKRAMLSYAGYDVQLFSAPGRTDLHIFQDSGPEEPINKDINAELALAAFEGPFVSIGVSQTAVRLALVIAAADPIETREAAVSAVAEMLGIASLPAGINEMEARVNRPTELNGVQYNRNLSWNVTEASIMVGSFMVGGSSHMKMQQDRSQVLLGQQIDVNTLAQFNVPSEAIQKVFVDMRALALPLIGKGLAAFDG